MIFDIENGTLAPVENTDSAPGNLFRLAGRTGYMRSGFDKAWVGDQLQAGTPNSIEYLVSEFNLARENAILNARAQRDLIAGAKSAAADSLRNRAREIDKSGAIHAQRNPIAEGGLRASVPAGSGNSPANVMLPELGRERRLKPWVSTKAIPIPNLAAFRSIRQVPWKCESGAQASLSSLCSVLISLFAGP
jgi:hypothetical protein